MKLKLAAQKLALAFTFLSAAVSAFANIPGGGNGSGPDVTLVNNGNGTVTMANGIVSILCTTASATINQINYAYNNSGTTVTNQLLANGFDGGKLYWETGGFGTGSFSYSAEANSANYCEMDLLSASGTNGVMDVHISMLRGSPGFYVTAIFAHRSQDTNAMGMGETRDNIYSGAIFNWMSVDAARNKFMEVQPGSGAVGVFGAPVECSLWTNGIYEGRFEDKYKYSADFGVQRVWGWSSVGTGGANVGLWQVNATSEYYSDGPMKRDLMSHIGTTILNYFESSHYGSAGTDGNWTSGEVWTKVFGPYFIYCNNITNNITATNQAAQMLYSNALAQAAAEATAWPYAWFTNSSYASAFQRGAISGQMVINDTNNPNASASNLWVGVVQQPVTSKSIYDFQQWMKTCQFWAKTGSNGNFTIPNVIAGANYTLFAFGPGAAGTFQSQALSGGGPPYIVDIPASPFSVTVTAGATNNLGPVTWTPTRVGPTVFEIGHPDRTGAKFRHGEDYWVGDIGPSPVAPLPIWTKFLEYPFDFPNGPNYTVGQSRWTTDWNFVQPVVTDMSGNYDPSTSTITFNLAAAPANGATASLYIATASDYQGALIVSVNGNNLGTASGATSMPNPNSANGYFPAYSGSGNESDTTVREGINSVFSDERITFPASLLNAGQNTITINMRKGGYFANHAMYDYIRLELMGYIPPPPASVVAYPGYNCNLVCWPVTPGATSYNILRSTTSGTGYGFISNGVVGPVCGSGWNNAAWLDTTAVNGTAYYYVVQSFNPAGASADSSQSSGVTPSASMPVIAPGAPDGLAVSDVGHQSVSLTWNPSSGANYYTVYRSTLYDNGGGASNILNTIVLANNVSGDTYTDTSPTDGSIYSYYVTATSAGGASGNSAPAVAVPLPAPPSSAPANVSVTKTGQTNYSITWSPVPGAVGYIISRATNSSVSLNYGTYVMSITETNWKDSGLSSNAQYFYMITAVNAAGTASSSAVSGPAVVWTGNASSAWNTTAVNWLNGSTATTYADGDTVTFNDSAANANVTITSAVFPGAVLFANASLSYAVTSSGGGISGVTSLIKSNSGSLTLNGTNAYTGGTYLSGGTLTVNNVSGSGTGSGAVTVSGGVLTGTGAIAGGVTINSGGTIAPGNPLGILTISNNLTLVSGCITLVQVQHSPLTNSAIKISDTLAEGGTLNVSNFNSGTFAAGDSFKVFNAGGYSGTFSNYVLPTLSAGLGWNTSALNQSGTLSVVAMTPPVISSVKAANGNLLVSGTGGPEGLPYEIQMTTNLVIPQWVPLATNQFDSSGNFIFTNPVNPAWPLSFYRLQVP